jgi:hypothetical protein
MGEAGTVSHSQNISVRPDIRPSVLESEEPEVPGVENHIAPSILWLIAPRIAEPDLGDRQALISSSDRSEDNYTDETGSHFQPWEGLWNDWQESQFSVRGRSATPLTRQFVVPSDRSDQYSSAAEHT